MVQVEPDLRTDKGIAGLLLRVRKRYALMARMDTPIKGLRAYANWVRSNYEMWSRKSHIQARPLKLTIDPTNYCQLRCALCPTGLHLHDRSRGSASYQMFENLLEEVGDYVFFMDFYNWGEPLLNPHVEDFIQLASSRKIVCKMSTNLSLPLTDDRIHRLVTCGLHELVVSLDGASSDTYATYRRQGQFDLVLENMKRIVAEKRRLGRTTPIVTWQFLVFRANEHEIEKARLMAEEVGVDRIAFRPPFISTDRYPLPEADRDPAKWTPTNPIFLVADNDLPTSGSACAWHYMSSAINWDGGVAPCCTLYEKQDDFGAIGPNGEFSYMAVQNNDSYRAIRERFAGRRSTTTGLICERCPTPSIQNLHTYLNRQIVLLALVGLSRPVWQLLQR